MQATGGYVGHILVLDMTAKTAEVIDTDPYEQWGGGHGMGSALFWDYCKDKTVGPFDPGNVVTISSNPFSGTPVPSSSARVEIQGIGSFPDPEWFTRSSMGGRVGGMMKAAGFDATVITGAADGPVWVSVVNGAVEFHDANELWGLDTAQTQERIWGWMSKDTPDGEWYEVGAGRDGGRTTQKPAVMCIGPAARTWRAHGHHHARRGAPCGTERAGRGVGLEEPQGAGVFGHGKHPGGRPCGAHSPAHRVSEEVRLQRGRPHSGNA